MKKYIVKYAIAAVAVLCSASCTNFDEINKNPYALYDSPAETFVQPILYNTEYALVERHRDVIAEIMQYAVNLNTEISSQMNYNYSITESYVASIWQKLYIQAGNTKSMLKAAEKDENPAIMGVALILHAMVMSNIADSYGNVPYFDAASIHMMTDNDLVYTTTYDDLKEIYKDMLGSLEEANQCFIRAAEAKEDENSQITDTNFPARCDYMYNGDVEKWRRFGNSLYLRLLMRCALKVQEEDGGFLNLGEKWGNRDLNVIGKIGEIYTSWSSGAGEYPVMRDREDAALVGFSRTNSALYTPFFSTTSGIWGGIKGCATIIDQMIVKLGTNPTVKDPRLPYYFYKERGIPTQLPKVELDKWMEDNVSQAGNYLAATYPRASTNANHVGDLQNADHYALMNYSELLFIFAEAGLRGWISSLSAVTSVDSLFKTAVTESILEWNPTVTASDESVTDFLDMLSQKYNVSDKDEFMEQLMWQKWVSTYWVGIEPWCDYRRTGYPILKTNGETAANNQILPTRLRYPSDEEYRNQISYREAVGGWLGGSNNMTTDIWWASTTESYNRRLLGRQ